MDAIIMIDGEEWSVKADEPRSPKSQAIFDQIRKKHSARGDGGVSAIIRNSRERKSLLTKLHRDGMANWVKNGSKAQFDELVREASSRLPFSEQLVVAVANSGERTEFKDAQDEKDSAVLSPAILEAAKRLAEPAIKSAKQKKPQYKIKGIFHRKLGEGRHVVGSNGILSPGKNAVVRVCSDRKGRQVVSRKPRDKSVRATDDRAP